MYFREVVASLYAWDLLDEGLEPMLDVLQEETLTNSAYLVALMHDEKRPLTDFYYPHNPRRKVYWTEDSRAYWRPNPKMYEHSRIQPLPSDNAELQGHDWLQELIDGSRRRNMTVGAELSHTWVDRNARAANWPTLPSVTFSAIVSTSKSVLTTRMCVPMASPCMWTWRRTMTSTIS